MENDNANLNETMSEQAKNLHAQMMARNSKPATLFTQADLMQMSHLQTLADLMLIVQELLNKNLIKLIKQNNELKFQPVDVTEAAKKSTMSSEEALVYSYIEASGREGIWTKAIKARSNLHQHVVLKCLKNLEAQRYVKSVKSVKYPTRKIYMLYNLQPSIDVTGGPWFTDSELDVEFINSLLTIVWRFVAERTYPRGFNNFQDSDSSSNSTSSQLYAPNVINYCTVQEILDFITMSQVANVELSLKNIRSLCEVLVYDDRLEKLEHDCYRVTLQSVLQMNGGTTTTTTTSISKPPPSKHGITIDLMDPADDGEFSIFNYYNVLPAGHDDLEAVYLDEWVL